MQQGRSGTYHFLMGLMSGQLSWGPMVIYISVPSLGGASLFKDYIEDFVWTLETEVL